MTNGLAYYKFVFITAVPAFIPQALQSTEVFETVFFDEETKKIFKETKIFVGVFKLGP